MTDRIEKLLLKLSEGDRAKLRAVFIRIRARKFVGLDLRKLKGHEQIYRVRAGAIRSIFRIDETADAVYIISVERRSDTTHNL